ncbi:restriction endonuclease [Methylococcus sp. Mc7]|uniref:restriction endonuclease n=1 Tax=Methylococcus sp. Mc7 TaxID=2860258 RepID=UPI001C5334A9|nr:restriction endonuclease [Methylococcus sp. Mc7]
MAGHRGSPGNSEICRGIARSARKKRGGFITTSSFTQDATDHASRIDTKVVLIDGQLLSNLMIDFDVGVSVAASYVIKRIDSDHFEEGEIGL